MTKFQKFFSSLPLGTSIYGTYFFIRHCPNLHTAGQGAVALLAPLLLGTPINIVCLLVFLISARYPIRKKMKNSSQIFGMEAGLIWGAILVLNAWFVIGISCFWIKWSHSVINPPKTIVRFEHGDVSRTNSFRVFGSLADFTVTSKWLGWRWLFHLQNSLKCLLKFVTGMSSPKPWKLLGILPARCTSVQQL